MIQEIQEVIHLQEIGNNSSFQFNRFSKGSSDEIASEVTFILLTKKTFDASIDNIVNFDLIMKILSDFYKRFIGGRQCVYNLTGTCRRLI